MCSGRRRIRLESNRSIRIISTFLHGSTCRRPVKKGIDSDDSIDRRYCIVLFLVTTFVVFVVVAVAVVAGTVLFDVHIFDRTYR